MDVTALFNEATYHEQASTIGWFTKIKLRKKISRTR